MITSVYLKNYKSFSEIFADFTINKAENPLVAIYGENGSGKTNLIETIIKLSESTRTIYNAHELSKIQEQLTKENENKDFLKMLASVNIAQSNISSVFKNSHTIGNTDDMVIKYSFNIKGKKGYYSLTFDSDGMLIEEKLYSIIGKRAGNLYTIYKDDNNKLNSKISPSLISSTDLRQELKNSLNRLWGTHTLLAIFGDIYDKFNKEFIDNSVLDNLKNIFSEFQHISFKNEKSMGVMSNKAILNELESGKINIKNKSRLEKTTEVLNQFFPRLYTDIKRVHYDIEEGADELHYQLIVEKKVDAKVINIPFAQESTGTKKLLELFPLILLATDGGTVIIDEIDTGIHDLLISKLVENLADSITGQLIFTTHDTLLMQTLPTQNIYVIQVDYQGRKRVSNLNQASGSRLRDSNNIQKLYLNGYFSGIPYLNDVDFDDILETIED
ncbi:AAA family ATPase [Leuconostoc mesenteroides]|uniref:AAA family ATPase n=1 Tax=Leuconostoc mesenteroides TaxID=1245 RepID=UPI001239E950|nr:AAA family ATPase [Leuconostoc mesenteroides]KAA8346857.1 ATP-binding cassette domain-containing protein [Leuconostoc mesenteroides]